MKKNVYHLKKNKYIILKIFLKRWLGCRDLNPDLQEPKSCVIPLYDSPKNYSQGELNSYCKNENLES